MYVDLVPLIQQEVSFSAKNLFHANGSSHKNLSAIDKQTSRLMVLVKHLSCSLVRLVKG